MEPKTALHTFGISEQLGSAFIDGIILITHNSVFAFTYSHASVFFKVFL